jgi:outer membrane protein assembly factor BamB
MKMKHLTIATCLLFGGICQAGDWAHWRGPNQNGVVADKNLPDKWSPNPSTPDNNLLWKVPHGGRTTPIVLNKRVYLINKTGEGISEQERVMCFSLEDGKLLWEHKFNVFHTDIVSVRLGWTTLAGDPETGNVYAHGTQGLFFCFDKDGKVLWSKSLTEEYGRITGYGGRVTSPIIEGNMLIIGMINASWGDQAIGRTRFVALDKKTGHVIWWGSTGNQVRDTYYSTPVVAEIGGQRLLISGGGDGGVHAFKVHTGEKVWSYLFGSGSVNCSPVVQDNLVFIGQGEENIGANTQGRVICLDGSQITNGQPKLVWQTDGIKAKFASPIIHEGLLYMCGEVGSLHALDIKDGKELWKFQYGRNTKGSPVLADGKIYIAEVNSKFHILKPSRESCEKLHSQLFRGKPGEDVEINGSPAIVDGKIIFMTNTDLYCIGKKGAPESPKTVASTEAKKGSGPVTHIQVFPADFVVHPGEKQEIKAIGYDSKGNSVGPVDVEWSLAGVRPNYSSPTFGR